jgi:exopolysaccharide production protein ExoQ
MSSATIGVATQNANDPAFMTTYQTTPGSHVEGGLSPRVSDLASSLRTSLPIAFVVFFFTAVSINVMPSIIPPAMLAGVLCGGILYHRELLYFAINNKLVVLYLVMVLASSSWSAVPSKSLWYALQLCATIGAAFIIGVSATQRQIVRGVFIAMTIIIVASIISGRQGASAAGPVLVGVTGGKTAIGFIAVLLVASATALVFDSGQPLLYRLAAVPLMPVGAYIATHVEAATAKVSLFAFPLVFFGVLALRYLKGSARLALMALMLAATLPLVIVADELSRGADTAILSALNKDATLTGRTLMWDKADHWIANSPTIGYGFRAFWASDSADSIGILHHFGLTDPRVFQLHNTVKEILVDTGWLGLCVFMLSVVIFFYYTVRLIFLHPSSSSGFLASMFLMVLAHFPVETVVVVFFPATVLFYVCGTAAIVHFMNARFGVEQR